MSGLKNYVSAACNLAEELRASLTEQDVDALHQALSGKQVADWIRWRNANDKMILQYVASTQSERNKKKRFQEYRLYLVMAAIQHCLEAHALLSVIVNSPLIPGSSYRDLTAEAGEAYNRLYEYEIPSWPFKQRGSPFVDDPAWKRE